MSRQSRKRRHNRGGTRIVLVGSAVAVVSLVVSVIAAVGYVLHVAHDTRALGERHARIGGGTSEVYAADGARLGAIQSDELRTPVGWSEIPTDLKNATVAIEDQRFYKDDGIDVTGIFRAAIKDIVHGQALQGASTITMQLVRNLYLGGDERTLKQKIAEAKLALEYNEHHSKRSILNSYLNDVDYGTLGGQTTIGVQAAARIFFDKPVSQLNLEQSALLAGLPQAPSQYNPLLNPAAATERRNEVLAKMAELHYISRTRAEATERAPLETHRGYYYSERIEKFFFEYVRQLLIERYGAKTVEQGGLKVYTTLDLRMQHLARKAIAEVLDEPGDPAAAIVTIDPRSGDIEAMAESESYEQSQYNLAADGHRQPGSTFKAIDLADALSRGVDPYTTYYYSHTLEPGWLAAEPNYKVQTFEGVSEDRSMNLVTATLKSDNTVYAQLAADLGEETITHTAHEMGVKEHLLGNPAQALGGLEVGVTPLEMANVYATLADGGYRNSPIAITKVVFPDGRVDRNWGTPHRVRVLSEAVTAVETGILHENVEAGTATRSAIDCPTAAKTGTTENLIDAWLDGYTPNYATAVWMGYPKRDIPMTDVHGEPQQGAYLPAEIWHAYMAAVTEGQICVPFPPSKEAISYEPFYGKYASTGLALQAQEAQSSPEHAAKPHKHSAPAQPGHGKTPGAAETSPPAPPAAPTGQPSTPPAQHTAEEPVDKQTGGSSPG
jgi:penicillin-binding protein 1A